MVLINEDFGVSGPVRIGCCWQAEPIESFIRDSC